MGFRGRSGFVCGQPRGIIDQPPGPDRLIAPIRENEEADAAPVDLLVYSVRSSVRLPAQLPARAAGSMVFPERVSRSVLSSLGDRRASLAGLWYQRQAGVRSDHFNTAIGHEG